MKACLYEELEDQVVRCHLCHHRCLMTSVKKTGLQYVYIGNVFTEKGENTWCAHCNALQMCRTERGAPVQAIKEGIDGLSRDNDRPHRHAHVYGTLPHRCDISVRAPYRRPAALRLTRPL